MKWIKFLFLGLSLVGLVIAARIISPFFATSNAFLKITTPEIESMVYLDGRFLGKTPYLGERMRVGDYALKLGAALPSPFNKNVVFSTPLTLTPAAITVVNYEFGPNETFSSGDIRTFRTGSGLSVVTSPSGAHVWLDGELVGNSPTSLNPNDRVHKLRISQAGFLTRELEVNVEEGFRLVVEVFLAANPFEEMKRLEEGAVDIYDLSSSTGTLTSDPGGWAAGVFFFEKRVDLVFDAAIDGQGNIYFKERGGWDAKIKKGEHLLVAYLGDKKTKGLSAEAKKTLADLKSEISKVKQAEVKQVQILNTPTGTLNVRSGPGLNYNVTAKVKPGEKYELLKEQSGWYQIKLSSGSGWISSQYAKKL